MTRYVRGVRAWVLGGLVSIAAGGCHVTTEIEATRPGATERIHHPDRATPRRATIALSEDGRLRFVEPLDCPSEDVTEQLEVTELATRPNLATFVVGVIVTSAGAILTARGALDGSGASIAAGLAGTGAGLALAVGPWLGLHRETRAGAARPPLRTPGPSEPCGDRPLAARAATLTANGVEVYGRVDADGAFAVSPYQLLDAYQLSAVDAWDIRATLDPGAPASAAAPPVRGGEPPRTVTAVLEGGALAKASAAFFAHADFDAKIEPLRLVSSVQSGAPRVSLTETDTGPALRVVLGVHNAGPGDVYALRGAIASSIPSIDGRIIYVGHLGRDQGAAREILIPLSPAAAAGLRGANVDVSIELRDAHGTAPSTPFRFHGPLHSDGGR